MSKVDYAYDVMGNLRTQQFQRDADPPTLFALDYDAIDRLTTAVQSSTSPATVLKRYAYTYDRAGNRTVEQIDNTVMAFSYDRLNRLLQRNTSGPVRVAGVLDEPAAVTVQGRPAQVDAANAFVGLAPVVPGTNVISVVAADASGNVRNAQYQVDAAGGTTSYTFDANGNVTSDGVRMFEWDARNRLTAVQVGTRRSEFSYDGHHRRVRTVEKDNGVTQSDTIAVWCGRRICEERSASGSTMMRRWTALSQDVSGAPRFFAMDRLDTVTEVTDAAGTVVARFAYDPWGRRVQVSGMETSAVGYTGHQWAENGGLWLTLYRAYDPTLGRWLSEDPAGRRDGMDLFAYVDNSPMNTMDPYGLVKTQDCTARQAMHIQEAVEQAKRKLNDGCCGEVSRHVAEVAENATYVCKSTLRSWFNQEGCSETSHWLDEFWDGKITLNASLVSFGGEDLTCMSLTCIVVYHAFNETQRPNFQSPKRQAQQAAQAAEKCCKRP